MASLRRHPWLLVLMLLASPAVGGQLMPLLHPCEVAGAHQGHPGAGHGEAGHEAHGAGHGSAPSGETAQCTCLGDCAPVASASAPTAPEVAVFAANTPPIVAIVAVRVALPPAAPPLQRLPPPTAPPRLA